MTNRIPCVQRDGQAEVAGLGCYISVIATPSTLGYPGNVERQRGPENWYPGAFWRDAEMVCPPVHIFTLRGIEFIFVFVLWSHQSTSLMRLVLVGSRARNLAVMLWMQLVGPLTTSPVVAQHSGGGGDGTEIVDLAFHTASVTLAGILNAEDMAWPEERAA